MLLKYNIAMMIMSEMNKKINLTKGHDIWFFKLVAGTNNPVILELLSEEEAIDSLVEDLPLGIQ